VKLSLVLHSAGVLAPGVDSLAALHALRRAGRVSAPPPLELPSPGALPANERRRASSVVRLTLACAEQALRASPFPLDAMRMVFAADEGTGEVCQHMLETVASTRQISPLLFHNSVHNAPAGYCSIAYRNHHATTSVSMGAESFACGLLCAASEAAFTGEPVLLLAYEPAMTGPMLELHPVVQPSATAWVLSASGSVPSRQQRLGDFGVSLRARTHSATFAWPAWLPPAWRANSSAPALLALSMLDETVPRVALDLPLGAQILHIE
jgi:Beta-ketoacyl synthase, N-terminal domain